MYNGKKGTISKISLQRQQESAKHGVEEGEASRAAQAYGARPAAPHLRAPRFWLPREAVASGRAQLGGPTQKSEMRQRIDGLSE